MTEQSRRRRSSRKRGVRDSKGTDIPVVTCALHLLDPGWGAAQPNRGCCVLIAHLYIDLLGPTSCSSSPAEDEREAEARQDNEIRGYREFFVVVVCQTLNLISVTD